MKRTIHPLVVLLLSASVYGQVGIGTNTPDKSAMLDIVAPSDNPAGVLLPRVALSSTSDVSMFNQDSLATSLLLYNTTDNAFVTPGFYFWFEQRWVRMMSTLDEKQIIDVTNEELAVDPVSKQLYLKDTVGGVVQVPISELNIETFLVDNGDGSFTYTNETQEITTVDIPAAVINNIYEIISDKNVREKIINVVTESGKDIITDNIISVEGGNKAVLHEIKLSVNDHSITNQKLIATKQDAKKLMRVATDGNLEYAAMHTILEDVSAGLIVDEPFMVDGHISKALLQPVNLKLRPQGITNRFLAPRSVSQDKMVAPLQAKVGFVPAVQQDASIVYQDFNEIAMASAQVISSSDQTITFLDQQGDILADQHVKGVLAPINLSLSDRSVSAQKLIGPMIPGQIPVSDASGSVSYKPFNELQSSYAFSADPSLTLSGNTAKALLQDVQIKVSEQGISTIHISDKAVTTAQIGSPKATMDGIEGSNILASDGQGGTMFIPAADPIIKVIEQQTKDITSDQIISVENGENSVFQPVGLSINDYSITKEKLIATSGDAYKVMSVAADGKIQYSDLGAIVRNAAQPLSANEPLEVESEGDISKALLQPINLKIKELGISNQYLAPQAVTQDKMGAPSNATTGFIPAVQSDASVKYQDFNSLAVSSAKAITSSDRTITFLDQQGNVLADQSIPGVLSEVNLSLSNQSVTTIKLAQRAVSATKLIGPETAGLIPVTDDSGNVSYQSLSTIQDVHALSADNSISLTGNASEALLQDVEIKVNNKGILTTHIDDRAVTSKQIGSPEVMDGNSGGSVLASDGVGGTIFITTEQLVDDHFQNDIVGTPSIVVNNGASTVFGDNNDNPVFISIKASGVGTSHLQNASVTGDKIASLTVTQDKLFAGKDVQTNRFALASATGEVSYQAFPEGLLNVGTLESQGNIIEVTDGVGAVFSDITLEVNDNSITVDKLNSGQAASGAVLTVKDDNSVDYMAITPQMITQAASLSTDGIIGINQGAQPSVNTLDNVVLQPISLQINNSSIDPSKLKGTNFENQYLASDGQGGVLFQSLDESGVETFDITTDDIIGLSDPTNSTSTTAGKDAVLAPLKLAINDNSIAITKLNSKNNAGANTPANQVLIADGQGAFTYSTIDALKNDGQDLILGNALSFTGGSDGIGAVLLQTSLDIANLGVTINKISSSVADPSSPADLVNADEKSMLVADGQGGVLFQSQQDLKTQLASPMSSDGSLTVSANTASVLEPIQVSITDLGVATKHLADQGVTTAKISSVIVNGTATQNAPLNNILVADSNGGTLFADVHTTFGKNIESTPQGGIQVIGGNQAALSEVTIGIANSGVVTNHVADNAITSEKIGSLDNEEYAALVADGSGGTQFISAQTLLTTGAKTLTGSSTISINGQNNLSESVLKDITLDINEASITDSKIQTKTITASRFSGTLNGTNIPAGYVPTSLGDGEVKYSALNTYGQSISGDDAIQVTAGSKAVLNPVSLTLKQEGVATWHLANQGVTTEKISSRIDAQNNAAQNTVLTANGQGAVTFVGVNNLIAKGTLSSSDNTIGVSNGNNAILSNVTLQVNPLSIATGHLINKSVSASKLGSTIGDIDYVGLTDGAGGVMYQSFSAAISNYSQDLTLASNSGLVITGGTGVKALNSSLTLSVGAKGIKNAHLDSNAVSDDNLATNAVTTRSVKNGAITEQKINSGSATSTSLLTADGAGGASFVDLKSMMPKFFYLPSVELTVVPAAVGITEDLYAQYTTQFGSPMASNPGSLTKSLPVLQASELNFHITYYDTDVFENVSVSDTGVLTYSVKSNVEITTSSFMNIVIEVK